MALRNSRTRDQGLADSRQDHPGGPRPARRRRPRGTVHACSRLGSAATAVYYVGSKDDLISFAADSVWSEVSLPDRAARTGAPRPRRWPRAFTPCSPGTSGWVQAFGSYMTYGPGKARYDDHALGVYEIAGFSPTEVDQGVAIVFTFVLGNALGLDAATSMDRKLNRHGAQSQKLFLDGMAKTADMAAHFPRLRARLNTPAAEYAASPEKTFEVGLRAILDGLDAQLTVRRTAPDQNRRRESRSPWGHVRLVAAAPTSGMEGTAGVPRYERTHK
jgi:hypothetical protein